MRLALEHDITFFGTPNPSTILKLVESANRNKHEIIKDIRDGTISLALQLAARIARVRSRAGSGKTPRARRRLESLIKSDGSLRPREYWPRLQLIGCWKGGTVGVRLKEFARWFGKTTPVRDLGYMASEAQMTLPISDSGSAGILAIDENFYEFIPESEIASPAPTILTCAELEAGSELLSRSHHARRALPLRYQRRRSRRRFLQPNAADRIRPQRPRCHQHHRREASRQPSDPGHGAGAERRGYRGATLSRLCRRGKISLRFLRGIGRCHASSRTSRAIAAGIGRCLCANSMSNMRRNASRGGSPHRYLCVMKPGWFERKADADSPARRARRAIQGAASERYS